MALGKSFACMYLFNQTVGVSPNAAFALQLFILACVWPPFRLPNELTVPFHQCWPSACTSVLLVSWMHTICDRAFRAVGSWLSNGLCPDLRVRLFMLRFIQLLKMFLASGTIVQCKLCLTALASNTLFVLTCIWSSDETLGSGQNLLPIPHIAEAGVMLQSCRTCLRIIWLELLSVSDAIKWLLWSCCYLTNVDGLIVMLLWTVQRVVWRVGCPSQTRLVRISFSGRSSMSSLAQRTFCSLCRRTVNRITIHNLYLISSEFMNMFFTAKLCIQ